jgi:type I restriction enzyme R subunit
MRDVRSAAYFEQMKGRGARTIEPADYQAVTPDAKVKDRFVLVDAIGVTEHDYVDAAPLDRVKSVSLKKLLDRAAALTLTEDEAATLAARLAKLELQLTPAERAELDGVAGRPLRGVVQGLVAAVDPDEQARAVAASGTADEKAVIEMLIERAVEPLAANPELRQRILDLRGQP